MTYRSSRRRTLGNEEDALLEPVIRSTCYCLGRRIIGKEFLCLGCDSWFHFKCLYDISLSCIGRLPFRVRYAFTCRSCSPNNREQWEFTHIYPVHVCVTALANLTAEDLHSRKMPVLIHEAGTIFIKIEDMLDFMEKNWNGLTDADRMTREHMKHEMVEALLENETLFKVNPEDPESYALNITLSDVSPVHPALQMQQMPLSPVPHAPPIDEAPSATKTMGHRIAIEHNVHFPLLVPKEEVEEENEAKVERPPPDSPDPSDTEDIEEPFFLSDDEDGFRSLVDETELRLTIECQVDVPLLGMEIEIEAEEAEQTESYILKSPQSADQMDFEELGEQEQERSEFLSYYEYNSQQKNPETTSRPLKLNGSSAAKNQQQLLTTEGHDQFHFLIPKEEIKEEKEAKIEISSPDGLKSPDPRDSENVEKPFFLANDEEGVIGFADEEDAEGWLLNCPEIVDLIDFGEMGEPEQGCSKLCGNEAGDFKKVLKQDPNLLFTHTFRHLPSLLYLQYPKFRKSPSSPGLSAMDFMGDSRPCFGVEDELELFGHLKEEIEAKETEMAYLPKEDIGAKITEDTHQKTAAKPAPKDASKENPKFDGVFKVPYPVKQRHSGGVGKKNKSFRPDPLKKCSKQIKKKPRPPAISLPFHITEIVEVASTSGAHQDPTVFPCGTTTRAAWKRCMELEGSLNPSHGSKATPMNVSPVEKAKVVQKANSKKPEPAAKTNPMVVKKSTSKKSTDSTSASTQQKQSKKATDTDEPITDNETKPSKAELEDKKEKPKKNKRKRPTLTIRKKGKTKTRTCAPSNRGIEKHPYSKHACVYFPVEVDPHAVITTFNNQDFRVVVPTEVKISPHDRAEELKVNADGLTVSGFEGYRIARATHGVKKGTWYYEVEFVEETEGSCVRVGWSREECPVQCALGYSRYSYAWRSLKGTKFHDGKGQTYKPGGYKQGDILGVLIHLPVDPFHPNVPSRDYLTPSRKNSHMHGTMFFRRDCRYFHPLHDDFRPFPGSKIEFFLNGVSCGVAYEDIYRGLYFPSVALYGYGRSPAVRFHFGDTIKFLPAGARRFDERAIELPVEQTLSDIVFLAANDKDYDDADY